MRGEWSDAIDEVAWVISFARDSLRIPEHIGFNRKDLKLLEDVLPDKMYSSYLKARSIQRKVEDEWSREAYRVRCANRIR